jgi:hypothetical protein
LVIDKVDLKKVKTGWKKKRKRKERIYLRWKKIKKKVGKK